MATPKTITIKGDPIRKELVANAAITPGMLCERMSTNKVRKHGSAGGNASPIFALEDDLQGNGIADDYVIANVVQLGYFRSGDEVYAWLADGQSVAIGDLLESDGAGMLQKHGVDSTGAYVLLQVVARALEAVDTTLSATVGATRILVEIV